MDPFIPQLIKALSNSAIIESNIVVQGDEISLGGTNYSLENVRVIAPIGIGKASAFQLQALISFLKKDPKLHSKLLKGMALTKDDHQIESSDFVCLTSAHPLLDQRGIDNTRHLIDYIEKLPPDALIIACLSGGASALLELPIEGLELSDLQKINTSLLNSGASIEEINSIRQALSQVKNGGLAAIAGERPVEVLVISDVSSNDLRFIGSGPFFYAPLELKTISHHLDRFLPPNLASEVKEVMEKQKSTEKQLAAATIHHHILLDWKQLLERGEALLKAMNPHRKVILADHPIVGSFDSGIAWHLDQLKKLIKENESFSLISGGELPVEVRGPGLGGRNTHFVLALGIEIFDNNILNLSHSKLHKISILSFATDGSDGPTPAAGAYLNATKWHEAKQLDLDPKDYLEKCNSFNFFDKLGTLIISGPTGNNVMDFRLIVWNLTL